MKLIFTEDEVNKVIELTMLITSTADPENYSDWKETILSEIDTLKSEGFHSPEVNVEYSYECYTMDVSDELIGRILDVYIKHGPRLGYILKGVYNITKGFEKMYSALTADCSEFVKVWTDKHHSNNDSDSNDAEDVKKDDIVKEDTKDNEIDILLDRIEVKYDDVELNGTYKNSSHDPRSDNEVEYVNH